MVLEVVEWAAAAFACMLSFHDMLYLCDEIRLVSRTATRENNASAYAGLLELTAIDLPVPLKYRVVFLRIIVMLFAVTSPLSVAMSVVLLVDVVVEKFSKLNGMRFIA